MKRLISIDILRGLAILLMIQKHFTLDLATLDSWKWVYSISDTLGAIPAPLFSFLLGLSLYLWIEKNRNSGLSEIEITKSIFRRGLFLFTFGLAYLVFMWGPVAIFMWDILTLLGISTVCLAFVHKWPVRKIFLLAFLVLIISPPLRAVTGYTPDAPYEFATFTFEHVLLGFLLRGFFPVLPWIVFPLVGFAVGKMLTLDSEQRLIAGRHILFAGFGFVSLAGISILAASIGPRSLSMFFGNVTFYPASTSFILMMNGMMSICFWLLNLCLDSRTEATQGVVISFLKRQSTFSLTIYVAHHMAYVWPMQVMAWWNGKPDVWYYNNKFASPPVVILLAILFIVIFDRVLVLWSTKRRYSVEAILRWLSEP